MPNEPAGFEYKSVAPEIPVKDLHPSPRSGAKQDGRNLPPFSGSDGEESKFFRCKQCGFVVNRRVNSSGSGWGNDTTVAITTISGGTAVARDPVSTAGCPLCNSSSFE